MRTESIQFGQALERRRASLSASVREGLARAPLFHAAWLFALGITIEHAIGLRPSFVLISVVLAAIACLIAASQTPRLAWLTLALLWILLGLWCAQIEPHPVAAPTLNALSDGLLRSIEGTVVDSGAIHVEAEEQAPDGPLTDAEPPTPSQRVDISISNIESVTDEADKVIPATGNVRLTIRWPAGEPSAATSNARFHCGDHIRTTARLLQPETYHDPGVWSREDSLIDQGITAMASDPFDQVEIIGHDAHRSLLCLLSQTQHASSLRILALPAAMRRLLPKPLRLTDEDAAMLAAMITGDRAYLTRSLRAGFERTGSFHMLVISGFHLAIVAGCVFWFTRRLRLPPIPATLITLAASFTYALFTGFATPVQRSLWMVTIYLIARLLYRRRSALNTVGFASLCLLAASPRSLFGSSLQMTLLAVVAIAGIASPLLENSIHPYVNATRQLSRTITDSSLPPRQAQFRVTLRLLISACEHSPFEHLAARILPLTIRSGLRLVELLTVSSIIEIAMTLPMALYFHRITVFALPVNLFILPLLLILMPAALITLLISLASPTAAAIPAIAVAIPLHFGTWLVRCFSAFRFGDLRIPTPTLTQSTIFCALLAAAMLLARTGGRLRRFTWAALLLAALAGHSAACGASARCAPHGSHRRRPGRLALIDHGGRKDLARRWRRLRRRPSSTRPSIRHRRRGGLGCALVARHPSS